MTINPTPANRRALRAHAREAMASYSRVMTWLVLDSDGDLRLIVEPQGQTVYSGDDEVLATTGSFHAAHGQGGAVDQRTGRPYRVQRDYLSDLLGQSEYARIFGAK